MRKITMLFLALALTGTAGAQPSAEVFLTARDSGDRLTDKGAVPFERMSQPAEFSATVMVDPGHTYQTIEGIGGALTDAAAETYAKLPKKSQQELLQAYYDPQKGIGYTVGRTNIGSCDFSSASYDYVKAGDTSLGSFSVAHDEKFRIPFIQQVLKRVPALKLFASPWSPPAWMKSNHDVLHGGKLLPQFADAWARYYVEFVLTYGKHQIPIWGLTVQNEPMAAQSWESCIYTAEEERDFVRDHLGPTLVKYGLGGLKLMIWDHNRGLIFQRASTVLNDPAASKYVWGTAFHWYMGEEYPNVGDVHEAFPNKAIFFSEGCTGPFNAAKIDDWGWGETYGRSMINDFNQWTCGWTDWNVLLDERGGPNHVANYCFAPIIADTRKGTLHYMNSYYYIGQFSKFVHPGARRIACSSDLTSLLATAFVNPDGQVATVVMNGSDKEQPVQVWSHGYAAKRALPAHSIATFVWRP
jgi:glucosylceramidase